MNELMLPVIDSSQQHPSTAPTHSSPSLSFSNDHSPSQIAKGEDIFESSLASVTDFTSLNDKHFPNYGDRSALQVSCQQKFDSSRRKLNQINVALKSTNDRGKKGHLLKQSKNLQVYSTLLYLSLMMHKIEEIKMLLKENDPGLYVENALIFDSMKSPAFHLQHQAINMAKGKKVFDRKQVYKLKFEEECAKVAEMEKSAQSLQKEVVRLQTVATETAHEFSESIKSLSASQAQERQDAERLRTTLIEVEILRSKLMEVESRLVEANNIVSAKADAYHKLEVEMSKKLHAQEMQAAKELQDVQAAKERENSILKSEINQYSRDERGQIEALKKKVESLESKLASESSKKNSLMDQLATAEKVLAEGGGRASEELKKDLENSDDMLNQAQKRIIILETQLEEESKAKAEMSSKLAILMKDARSRPPTAPAGDANLTSSEQKTLDAMHKQFHQSDEFKPKPESEYSEEERRQRDTMVRKLQGRFRQKLAYDRWFRVKLELTAKAGVMMALAGTAQGFSGWYLNPSSQSVFYYRVTGEGEWINEFEHISEEDYKDICSRLRKVAKSEGWSSAVPVDLEKGQWGQDGWYCKQDMKCAYLIKDGDGMKIRE